MVTYLCRGNFLVESKHGSNLEIYFSFQLDGSNYSTTGAWDAKFGIEIDQNIMYDILFVSQ
jgi:hypothetical protein